MDFLIFSKKSFKSGFGLVETLVAVAIFVLVSIAIYNGFGQLMRGLAVLEIKNKALNLANEKIEIARNLPYEDVGVLNGIPSGKLNADENIERNGTIFNVITSVKNIDDPFDGTFDGEPQDESPADYKLVQVDISCSDCLLEETITLYTKVAPQNLEVGSNNGALFIRVFDSYGQPIQGANISVFSDDSTTTIDINETSDAAGYLKIYDIPPGYEAYEIEVTKSDYSTEKTYPTGDSENPIPKKPHLTVVAGEITNSSFIIDKLSYLSLRTKRETCSLVSNVDFNIHGSKEVGYDVYKYDSNLSSGGSGRVDIENIEWDDYYIDVFDGSYKLYGASTLLPIRVNPNTDQGVDLIIGSDNPRMLLVQVRDTGTGLPLSNAQVTLSKVDYNETKITGNGFIHQTDWSGGSGQTEYDDETRFYLTDGGVEYNVSGQLILDSFNGSYVSDGYLESSIIDLGTTSNFLLLSWQNEDQPEGTSVKFQIATNELVTATSTWNFVGPNGNGNSYYTNSGESIYSGHNGDRYLKYKVFLESNISTSTPLISDINFTYSSGCVAPGQVLFGNLDAGVYQISVERDGYTTYEILDLEISKDWDLLDVPMTQ